MNALALLKPFGFDFFCLGKKFLVFNLVSRNLKVKYRRSILGIFWTLCSPLAVTLVYYFVFKVILKVSIPHYLAFIVSGILPWTFFSQSLNEGLESIVGNQALITKVPVPLQVFPYVGVVTNLITLMIATPVILGASIVSGVSLGASLIMLFFYLPALFLMTYSLTLMVGEAFVYFRDLKPIMGIILQVWMYATPVVYRETMIPERFRWMVYANPVGTVFTGLHAILVDGLWPDSVSVIACAAWAVALTLGSVLVHRSTHRNLVESL